eukprot:TRINITY_DN1581_c0_g1_i5.p1 TRINITY_DN1581_c0_g1~~TRINITY_DN1581_c0_g1_i5.p1  ORF type:complete len:271 (-),score=91.34 TRINITY_DN1581_c0_g1_i5:162-974(-)
MSNAYDPYANGDFESGYEQQEAQSSVEYEQPAEDRYAASADQHTGEYDPYASGAIPAYDTSAYPDFGERQQPKQFGLVEQGNVEIEQGNVEICPGCNEVINAESGEKIIVAGKEWHKTCRSRQIEPRRQYGEIEQGNVEICPGCNEVINAESGEKVIVAGKEWHKTCRQRQHEPRRQYGEIEQGNVEICPGCNEVINAESGEKVIVAGKEWHKTCRQRQNEPRRQYGEIEQGNVEICPGCNEVINAESGEKRKGHRRWKGMAQDLPSTPK